MNSLDKVKALIREKETLTSVKKGAENIKSKIENKNTQISVRGYHLDLPSIDLEKLVVDKLDSTNKKLEDIENTLKVINLILE